MRIARAFVAATLLDADQYRRGGSRAACEGMLIRIRKLVLYLLLASLPLQSVAGPAQLLLCNNATPADTGSWSVHGGGEVHPAHEESNDQDGAFANDCCQQNFPVVLHSSASDAGQTGIVYIQAGWVGFSSFNPKPLKRPPRAALAV